MSETPLPYIAPWIASFERFATLVKTPADTASVAFQVDVPAGQWWRVIYAYVWYDTGGNLGDRMAAFQVAPPGGGSALLVMTPYVQPDNDRGIYTFGPGLNGYAVTGGSTPHYGQAPLPDLLWPPGSGVALQLLNATGTDAAVNTPQIAVEVYAQTYETGGTTPVLGVASVNGPRPLSPTPGLV